MAKTGQGKLPLPLSVSFVACRAILSHSVTNTTMLMDPINHVSLVEFPANVCLSLWVEITGGHGSYLPRLCLLDHAEEVVWDWNIPDPIVINHPLMPFTASFLDLVLHVPTAGRYRLALLLNGEEFAHRMLWLGSTAALTE